MTREPLLHFALLGALLFAARTWSSSAAVLDAPSTRLDLEVDVEVDVEVDAQVVEAEALRREARFALPSGGVDRAALRAELEEEERRLLDARALGLDRSDLVVRRRLAQKMELVLRAELDPSLDSEEAVERALERAIQARVQRYRVVLSDE